MGPAAGIIIEAMKILLNFIISGTVTAGVGELANFAIGCSMVLPAGLIYRYHKTRKMQSSEWQQEPWLWQPSAAF